MTIPLAEALRSIAREVEMRRTLSNLLWALGNLVAGLRMMLPPHVSRESFHFSSDQLIILMLIEGGVTIVTRYPFDAPGASFSRYGLALLAAGFFSYLLVCYIVAKIQRAPHSVTALAIAILAISVPFHIFDPILSPRPLMSAPVYVVLPASGIAIVWFITAMTRAIRLVYECTWRRGLVLAVAFFIALAGVNWVFPDELWSEAEARAVERDSVAPINTERTYYAQGNMVRDVLSHIAESRPGIGELYFIALAGTSTQDVFLKEARATKDLFDARFDTHHRSVILVNNRRTASKLPVASGSNLRLALTGLARKMDTENDVLFLYLTSHGSQHRFSLHFPDLALNDLSDRDLRDMLDKSGIKWRVVVISACYSGSFIDALKDEHTLIITAAAADRTSFGCSDENDWTYFGDAYVNVALRHGYSFIDAFDDARTTIAKREQAEKLTASEPQIYVGEAIRAKLHDLEGRLRRMMETAPIH